jgi:tetratricopeptide (TPR) repeat protein
VNLANLCLQKQRLDESRDFFLKAARLAPRDPAGWMGLRQVSYLKGDIATYVRATLAVMHRLEDEDIADAVGRLRELQHLDQVDTILAQADKLGKSGDELDAERMLAYHRSGNSASSSPSASMLYQRLARLSNPSEHVRYCLAWYSLITDKPDRAARFLEELDGEQEGVRKLQWRVMIAQRRFDEVEQALEQYLEKNPTCFDAWFQLARMEAARGNIRTATLHMKNARTHGLSAADIADENPELKKIFDKQSKA